MGPSDRVSGVLPSAILFDMDDTIFDHSLTSRAALRELRFAEPVLRRRTLTEVWHEYGRLLEAVHPDVLAGRITVDRSRSERFRRLAEFCGGQISEREGEDLSRRYRARYRTLRRPVPGAPELLRRLHGRAVIGIVTNNQVAEQEEKLVTFGLRDLVDLLVVSEGVGVAKPDPEIFRIALERANAAAEDAVMLGDSWALDVLGARSAGIRAVWFNRFRLPNPDPLNVREVHSLRPTVSVERALAFPRSGLRTVRKAPSHRS